MCQLLTKVLRALFIDEVRRVAVGGHRLRAAVVPVHQRCGQHPRRVPDQWPQPLGRVRECYESAGSPRPQRDGDQLVPAEEPGGQLHGRRRVQNVPVCGEHHRHRSGAQRAVQCVRQPVVHLQPPARFVPQVPSAAASATAAQQRHQVRRGQ